MIVLNEGVRGRAGSLQALPIDETSETNIVRQADQEPGHGREEQGEKREEWDDCESMRQHVGHRAIRAPANVVLDFISKA